MDDAGKGVEWVGKNISNEKVNGGEEKSNSKAETGNEVVWDIRVRNGIAEWMAENWG